jgi:hypothetical protein
MARPLWGQGLVPPMGGFSKAAPLGCGFFTSEELRLGIKNTDGNEEKLIAGS